MRGQFMEKIMDEIKPGWKTTEFWLSAAVSLIGLLMASGVIEPGGAWDKIVGLASAALSSLGYSASRGQVKSGS